jgi:hypothetical protein
MCSRHPVVTRLLMALSCYFFLSGIMQSLVSLRGVAAGLSGLQLGLTLGLASGALGIFIDMPVAALADRRGKYAVVQVGMACSLVASVVLLAGGRAPLVVGAVLAGISASAGGNALLSWLGSVIPAAGQARLQGLNGSVQRIGALIAAAIVGIAIAARLPAVMAAAAVLVSAVGLLVTHAPVMRPADTAAGGPGGFVGSYRRGFCMLSNRGLLLAAGINTAVNVIFLETNSYVPLAHGPDRAAIVTGTLVARDLAAVAVGAGIAIRGINVALPRAVAGALAVAAVCAWAGGFATDSLALIVLGGIQGAVIGMCIAAANLFTIGAIPAHQRTLAMAASVFPSRVMYVILPIGSSVVLRAAGLPDVFRLLGALLLALGVAALLLGRLAVRAAGQRPEAASSDGLGPSAGRGSADGLGPADGLGLAAGRGPADDLGPADDRETGRWRAADRSVLVDDPGERRGDLAAVGPAGQQEGQQHPCLEAVERARRDQPAVEQVLLRALIAGGRGVQLPGPGPGGEHDRHQRGQPLQRIGIPAGRMPRAEDLNDRPGRRGSRQGLQQLRPVVETKPDQCDRRDGRALR